MSQSPKKTTTRSPGKSAGTPRGGPPAAQVYGNMVQDIIDSRSRDSTFKPGVDLQLALVNPRKPKTIADLSHAEHWQLECLFGKREGGIEAMLTDEENQFEIAEIVDSDGHLVYRIFAWNYGVGYLVSADTDEVIGMGCQHDIEHWHLGQRDIFYALDRALRQAKQKLEQPLNFCWAIDECWAPEELWLKPGQHVILDRLKCVPADEIAHIPPEK